MFRPVVAFLSLLFASFAAFAQFAGPGAFVLEGFFGQQLHFQPLTGDRVDLGDMPPTSARLRMLDDQLCIVAGSDFTSGTGSALHLAEMNEIEAAIAESRPVQWETVPLPDFTNPYDAVLSGGLLFISCQQSSSLMALDPSDGFAEVAVWEGLPNPQGLASNGSYICVANSGYGYNNTVTLVSIAELDTLPQVEVWDNPQEIAVDDMGRFHVLCSGRSWEGVGARVAVIDPFAIEPSVTYLDVDENPGEIIFVTGPEDFGGKMVLGDEYTPTELHIQAYRIPELTGDGSLPAGLLGGWSLAAGFNGLFIGSTIHNTLTFYTADWGGEAELGTFPGGVADLLAYDAGQQSTMRENLADLPRVIELSPAWPNPFNASTTLTLTLGRSGWTTVELFDLLGRQSGTLLVGQLSAGRHSVVAGGETLASGTYLVRVRHADGSAVQRVTLVR